MPASLRGSLSDPMSKNFGAFIMESSGRVGLAHINEEAGGEEGEGGALIRLARPICSIGSSEHGLRKTAAVFPITISDIGARFVLFQLAQQRAQHAIHLWPPLFVLQRLRVRSGPFPTWVMSLSSALEHQRKVYCRPPGTCA